MRLRATAPVLRAVLATLLVGALCLVGAGRADAHARLESSTPEDGASVSTLPRNASLRFSEALDPQYTQIVVTDARGRATRVPDPQVDGQTATVPLDPSLPQGRVTLSYRVVSQDSHPVAGAVAFTYRPGAAAPGPRGATTGSPSPTSSASSSSTTSSSPAGPSGTAPGSPAPTTAAPQSEDEQAGSSSPLPWIVGGAALVLVAGLLLALTRRSRRD